MTARISAPSTDRPPSPVSLMIPVPCWALSPDLFSEKTPHEHVNLCIPSNESSTPTLAPTTPAPQKQLTMHQEAFHWDEFVSA